MIRHVALCDGYGVFPEPLERIFPAANMTGSWSLHVHCHLLLAGGQVVLVDVGTGPPWAPASSWFPEPGRLLTALDRAGLRSSDVTDVVMTHLHVDHVGWAVHGEPRDPKPTFPNARHLVQRVELSTLARGTPAQRGLFASHIRPLANGGLLDPIDGTADVLPGVALVRTPGHTPGHQCVAVDLGDETLLISGDAFVHPIQVTDAAMPYIYEDDPALAAQTRRLILEQAATRRTMLAPAHFDATVAAVEMTPNGPALVPVEICDVRGSV